MFKDSYFVVDEITNQVIESIWVNKSNNEIVQINWANIHNIDINNVHMFSSFQEAQNLCLGLSDKFRSKNQDEKINFVIYEVSSKIKGSVIKNI